MDIVESILTKNPCYKAGKKITPKGLMLHSVCTPQPSAKVLIHNWNRPGCENKCAHAFIDANTGIVYQTLPFNHRGRHCGRHPDTGNTGNDTHIGVEMCEPAKIKYNRNGTLNLGEWVTDPKVIEGVARTYNSAVELFANLCDEYSLDPATDIVSHKEAYEKGFANNKSDPEYLWETLGLSYTMDGFRGDVAEHMKSKNSISEEPAIPERVTTFAIPPTDAPLPEIKPMPPIIEQKSIQPIESIKPKAIKVQIDVENLRIRSGPGKDFEPTGKFTGVGVFLIEEIQNGSGSTAGWGKLQNGLGWICLDYAKPMIGV